MTKHYPGTYLSAVGDVSDEVARYLRAARAPGTIRSYSTAYKAFQAWCAETGKDATAPTPLMIAEHLAHLANTRRFSTIKWHLVGLVHCYRQAGFDIDTKARILRDTLQGIERVIRRKETRSAAIMLPELKKLLNTCDSRSLGVRDRAILLIGFAGAFRRSEIVALDVRHLAWSNDSLAITVEQSKEDQRAKGERVVIAYGKDPQTCPVRALKAWLDLGRITSGPVFRCLRKGGHIGADRLSDKAVDRLIKWRCESAGIVAPEGRSISSHGLRAGFITEAFNAGLSDEEIMGHTRHQDVSSMRGYVRRERLSAAAPSSLVGL
jgi:integrase